jgi:Ca-activated chloride channel family protein
MCLLTTTGHATDAKPTLDKTLSPYFVVRGAQGEEALPLESTRADVSIAGVIAKVRVSQVYQNRGQTPLEAVYVFPSSTRAAVFGMEMRIGDRTIRAKINEKEAARKVYEKAKQQGKSASLLEQHRPNVFQMNVANIMPGDRIEVRMDYVELLSPRDGEYSFVYPAVVGPRYTEATTSTAADADKFTKQPYQHKGTGVPYGWDIRVNLDTGMPITRLSSPSHALDQRVDGSQAEVRLADETQSGDSDFILNYGLRGDAVETGLMLFPGKDSADEKFFLMMMQPPQSIEKEEMPGREYVFILDVSGSMRGRPLRMARQVISSLLDTMGPSDRFNILTFSGGSRVLSDTSLPVTQANVARIQAMLQSLHGGGGTRLLPALERAFQMPAPEEMSRTFVVVTDGYISVEAKAFELVRNRLQEANLFAFGIGSSVNRHLIEGMARAGQGEPFIVTRSTDAELAARRFSQYISSPALANIQVQFNGFHAYDIEPKAVPDLFAARPILVYGKYRGKAKGSIVVTGNNGRGTFRKVIRVSDTTPSKDNEALPYLWARARIATLSDIQSYSGGNSHKKSITELGLGYNLMTAYTSFVAVDESIRNTEGKSRTQVQPLPLPKGVEETAVSHRSLSGTVARKGSYGGGVLHAKGSGFGGGRLGPTRTRVHRIGGKALVPETRLRLTNVKVDGVLSKPDIDRVLKRRVRAIAKALGPNIGSALRLELVIKSGVVSKVRVLSNTLNNSAKNRLVRLLMRLRFPKDIGTTTVRLRVAH